MPTLTHLEVTSSPKISVKTAHTARADVGIGPYRVLGESVLPHTFLNAKLIYRRYLTVTARKFGCTVTGGAYHGARGVILCCHDT